MSHVLTHMFQHSLKENFPGFAYWLYYSEMSVAIFFALITMQSSDSGSRVIGIALLVYAASSYLGARNYARKIAEEHKQIWSPSGFDRVVAVMFQIGVCAGGAFILVNMADNWVIISIGIALLILPIFPLFRLLTGRWVNFP